MTTDEPAGSDDPTVIRSIAVAGDDLVAALEANLRGDRDAVLRVTPPFAGRMRARLHVAGGEATYGDVRPLHVDPEALIESDAPAYPDVDRTADELRADGEYSVEKHREHHVEAVTRWRAAVREHAVDRVELDAGDGTHAVEVKLLG
jgi:hypothetical protein